MIIAYLQMTLRLYEEGGHGFCDESNQNHDNGGWGQKLYLNA